MDPSSTQYFVLIVPICLIVIGCVFLAVRLIFKGSIFLLWLGLGYILPSLALAAQSLMNNAQLTQTSLIAGLFYLSGAWASAYAMALRAKAGHSPKLTLLIIIFTAILLFYFSQVNENLWMRMLCLNLSIACIESLVIKAIIQQMRSASLIDRLVDITYILIVIYTFARVLVIWFFLQDINLMLLSVSKWWMLMLATSILLNLWFAIILLASIAKDIFINLNEDRHKDPLTHLLNRRGLFHVVDHLDQNNKQYFLSIADLDFFKRVNDTWGHLVGDQLLQEISQLIQNYAGSDAIVARFGGEEFIILFQAQDLASAYQCIEQIRITIADTPFLQQKISMTASFGLIPMTTTVHFLEVLNHADQLLYRAKRSGRNQVCY